MSARGVSAAEELELEELRQRAAQRRQEVGDTLAALVGKVAETASARALAKRVLTRAERRAQALSADLARRPATAAAFAGTLAATAALWWAARHRETARLALAAPTAGLLARRLRRAPRPARECRRRG